MQMFSFSRWDGWLSNKAIELRNAGLNAEHGSNDKYLRGSWINITHDDYIASFRLYGNAFVDYEILDTATKKWRANEAMIVITDQNFEKIFGQFMNALPGENTSNRS